MLPRMNAETGAGTSQRPSVGPGARLLSFVLILLMAVGSVILWLGIPIACIYGASRLVNSAQPSLGPLVLVLVSIPVGMVLMGKVLSRLQVAYGHVTHTTPTVTIRAPWHRSMRDGAGGHPRSVQDVVMVSSVGLVLAGFGLWFLFLAQGGGV